jgi:hypothetical protein
MKKNIKTLAVLLLLVINTNMMFGQSTGDVYIIQSLNPSFKIFNQNFLSGNIQSKYGNIPDAPRGLSFMSSAMLGENAGIGLDIHTYSVGVFHRDQYYAKYSYKIGISPTWFLGMGIGISMDINAMKYSELTWADPTTAIPNDEKFLGSSGMAGFLVTNNKTLISLYGERTILGLSQGREIDTDMEMLVSLEVAQRFKIGSELSLRIGIETQFVDFSAFNSLSTLPVVLDLSLRIYDIIDIGFKGNHNYTQGKLLVNAKWCTIFYEYSADYGYQMMEYPTNTIGFVAWFGKNNNTNQTMIRTKISGGQ